MLQSMRAVAQLVKWEPWHDSWFFMEGHYYRRRQVLQTCFVTAGFDFFHTVRSPRGHLPDLHKDFTLMKKDTLPGWQCGAPGGTNPLSCEQHPYRVILKHDILKGCLTPQALRFKVACARYQYISPRQEMSLTRLLNTNTHTPGRG